MNVAAPKTEVGKMFAIECWIENVYSFCCLLIVTKLPETTTIQPSTTNKPAPCELPKKSIERSEDKLAEKTPEKKETSTSKPTSTTTSSTTTKTTSTTKNPIKWTRQRRSAINSSPSASNKRCIGQLFNSPLFPDSVLGAANPSATETSIDSVRYARSIDKISQNVQSTKVEDSFTGESMLQGVPMKQQRSIKIPFDDGPNRLNFLTKMSLQSKTENLLHGNIINSFESNELRPKSSIDEADSSQSDSTIHPHAIKSIVTPSPPLDNAPVYRPEDYLPSYEYFPKNSQASFNPPQYYPQEHPPKRQNFVVGPNSFKSTPFIGEAVLEDIAEIDNAKASLQSVDKTSELALAVAPSGCRCDPEHFNDLLHHMQSGYRQFHNGMIQLFDTFKSQSNCGASTTQRDGDSSSSPSQSNFDYQVSCKDKNHANGNPQLAVKCEGAFDDSYVNPSSGYYEPPGENIKTGGFHNQFLTFSDYTKMMRNVNANSGTLMSSSFNMDDQVIDSAKLTHDERDQHDTVKQLKQHINQYQEPIVTAAEPSDQTVTFPVPQKVAQPKFPKFEMKALLGNLRLKH